MNKRIYKAAVPAGFAVIFSLLFACFGIDKEIKLKESIFSEKETEAVNKDHKQIREYGYWEIFEIFYGREDIIITVLDDRETASGKLKVEMRYKGDNFKELIGYLSSKDNFSGISRISVKDEAGKEVVTLHAEFLKGR
jgi:hypothetical protein